MGCYTESTKGQQEREHLPPVTTAVLPLASQSAVKSIPIPCQVRKRVLEECLPESGKERRFGWGLPHPRAGEQVKPYSLLREQYIPKTMAHI